MIQVTVSMKPHSNRGYDLLYVLPEWEVTGHSRPENNKARAGIRGLPATVKFYETSAVALFDEDGDPLDTHRLLRERFALQCPKEWDNSEIDKHLGGYLKDGVCYTDNTNPPAWNSIVTCGNVLYPTGKTRRTAGGIYFEVVQLQADTYERMKAQLEAYPFLETWATISTREHGGRGVEGFPQCGGNPVPALLFCKTATNWIKAERVRMLERDEPIPPIYYP